MHLFSLLASNYNKMLAVDEQHEMIRRLDDSPIICHDVVYTFNWLRDHHCDDDIQHIGFMLNFLAGDEYPRFTSFHAQTLDGFEFDDPLIGYKYCLVGDNIGVHLNVDEQMAQIADHDDFVVDNEALPLQEDMVRYGIFDYMDVEQNTIDWARIAEI